MGKLWQGRRELAFRGFASKCLTWLLVFLLTFVFTVSWGYAQVDPSVAPQPWQLRGILAALDDSDPQIWALALDKLSEYKIDEIKPLLEISEDKYKRIVELLDYKQEPQIQSAAVYVLGEIGAKEQADKIATLLSSSNDSSVQTWAAIALGKIGAKEYADSLVTVLTNPCASNVQSAAVAYALKKLGAEEYAEQIATSLSSNYSWIQECAAIVLGQMKAKEYADELVTLLATSYDSSFRGVVAIALGEMEAKEYAAQIANLLSSSNVQVQEAAVIALRKMKAKEYADKLVTLLATSYDLNVREAAAVALGEMEAKEQANKLVTLLATSENISVQTSAAIALGRMKAKEYAAQIAALLSSQNTSVQYSAVVALGQMGAQEYAEQIASLLSSNTVFVQTSAAIALGQMKAKEYAEQIAALLSSTDKPSPRPPSSINIPSVQGGLLFQIVNNFPNTSQPQIDNPFRQFDINVQSAAAIALGQMGAKEQADKLVTLLGTSNDTNVQNAAAIALGRIGAKEQADEIATLLGTSNNSNIQSAVADILGELDIANKSTILTILNSVYKNQWLSSTNRFLAYFLSDANEETLTLIKWLGLPQEYPDLEKLGHEQAVKTLDVFKQAWQPSESLPRLRNDLEKQIAKVVKQGKWQFQDIVLLQSHYQNLQAINSTHADAVKAKITNLQGWKWIFAARNILLTHFGFWALLIFAYPKSPQIQAIFFWNPWVRRIIGLGYVEFLLTWIPFIRSRLFAPFKESLLADAKLGYADLDTYFPDSSVKIEASGKTQPLSIAIPQLKGQVILQGESGLGKSLFLRHLVKNSQRITVYLTADRCTKGVIKAIQNKLKGKAKDHNFLRNLIYSGAMDICIDGLNEVDADTRANIKQFVEDYFKGNIIITTQPLEWKPPATAKIYILQPLAKSQIKEFLLSRQSQLAAESTLSKKEFEGACLDYLAKAFDSRLSTEEFADMRQILSNPMDLTILSQIIASGESPDIFSLQQQQYELMAEDYKSIQLEQFPLDRFSEHAYQMRLDNLPLSESDFLEELQCMERHKMIICQQSLNAANEPVREWKFRHDKIWEFFAVQAFLKYEDRPSKHIQDSRFRGVYFLLVNLLSLEDAEILREELIQYAADTGNHTVSDRFVQLLRTRKAKSVTNQTG
ncbi:MAG: HEAT repeat domain-containing protein [Cyanobacteria bacterium P01_G01_bin.39]